MQEKLNQDIKTAMLARDSELTGILKYLKSILQKEQVDKGELNEETAVKLMQKEAKKRQEAFELYEKAGDKARADQEIKEKAIIEKYLPLQMSEEDISKIVEEVVASFGEEKPHMGAVMQAVIKQTGSAADGSVIARIVNKKLN